MDSDDENESCLVLRIDINGVSFLAPGDIGKETEEAEIICAQIRKYLPDFEMEYRIDPLRQAIAESSKIGRASCRERV